MTQTVEVVGGHSRSLKTAEIVARQLRRLIVDGQLKDGDYLPTEAELIHRFAVSRATMREAVRLLESDGLIEVRRGSRSGARVRIPGPEIVARPAGLLLQVSGATMADVMAMRARIEPVAAKLLAQRASAQDCDELEDFVVNNLHAAFEAGRFVETAEMFHRRLVELSGSATLCMIAGMLHEITERHFVESIPKPEISMERFHILWPAYPRLLDLVRAGDGDAAEAHWSRHMDEAQDLFLAGLGGYRVRDIVD